MQHYNVDIDISEIMSGVAAKRIRGLAYATDIGMKNGIIRCEKEIISQLKHNMSNYGLGGSALSGTIKSKRTEDSLSIRMGGSGDIGEDNYFMFVEYGTGVVGKDNRHPDVDRVGWEYDVNEHGDAGWWYPSNPKDPNPIEYTDKDGQVWAWTAGQKSRPFMYETWLWANKNAGRIISEEIGKEIKKLRRGRVK